MSKAAAAVAAKPAALKPKPAPASAPIKASKAQSKLQARRAIEERALAKRTYDDWHTMDNDFLPDA